MNEVDPVAARARARVGQTLRDKWRLDRLLGVGGMAAVYAGTHRNGARGAIKVLHLELSLDTEIRQRFLREGYAANVVGHPGVVRALDDDTAEDGSVFLVLELLDGEPVDRRWERAGRRLSVDEALAIIDQLLAILDAAHAKGVVHRDLKPENLFICRDGSVKLLDFGIARVRESSAQITRTGMTAGTPAFMAPEQALGRSNEIGPWTDLWAVGAVLFSLLSGRFVHEGQSPNELLIAAATRPAPSLASYVPGAPEPLVAFVARALSFERTDRWESAAAMRQALNEVRAQLDMRAVRLEPPPEAPEPTLATSSTESRFSSATTMPHSSMARGAGHRGPRLAAGAGLVAAAAAGVVWALLPGPPKQEVVAAASSPPSNTATAPPVAPVASASAPVEQKGPEGKLMVKVRGGDCEVFVAGTPRGTTRGGGRELTAPLGEQVIRCDLGDGQVLTQIATIKSSGAAQVTFTIPKASKTGPAPSATATPAPPPTTPPAATPAPVDPMDRRR